MSVLLIEEMWVEVRTDLGKVGKWFWWVVVVVSAEQGQSR